MKDFGIWDPVKGGDLLSRLSNRPYRASYGLLWWLIGILTGLTKSTDHPSYLHLHPHLYLYLYPL